MQIRLYNPQILVLNSNLFIKDNQYHYLVRVMRLRVGDIVRIFNSIDGEFAGKIIDIQKDHLELELVDFISPPKPVQELTLYFAPIKNSNTSFIVQKATELGATKIQPIITKRTMVVKANVDKLELVAMEAAEQCERFSVPRILPIQRLEYVLKNPLHSGALIFCNEKEASQPLAQYLEKDNPQDAGIMIGPEGGFTDTEAEMIIKYKGISVSLGNRILRAETAIIATLSVYQAIAGDWNISQ